MAEYYARPQENGERFQSLHEHITHVANYARELAEPCGLGNAAYLAGLVHDMGKYSDDFQEYILSVGEALKKGQPLKRSRVDHGVYGGKFIYQLAGEWEGEEGPAFEMARDSLCMAACYHHGGLNNFVPFPRESDYYLKKRLVKLPDLKKSDDCQEIFNRFYTDVCSYDRLLELFGLSVQEFQIFSEHFKDFEDQTTLVQAESLENFAWQMVVRFIYSVLVDADRWDAYCYQLGRDLPLSNTLNDKVDSYLRRLYDQLDQFDRQEMENKSEEKIKNLRQEVSESCSQAARRPTGLYSLTVPTGGGKTLSSLRFALEHVQASRGTPAAKERIIYVLPYTTIIEQNAADVREILGCDMDEVLEIHSQLVFDEKSKNKGDGSSLIEEYQYKLLAERYNSPIIFMTQVSFLETLIKGRAQNERKFHRLANSVIIMDEAQTIPLNSTDMANASLDVLTRCFNSTVVMCTATKPALEDVDVPLLYSPEGEIIPDVKGLNKALKRMEIQDKREEAGHEIDQGASWLLEVGQGLSSILVVMNTKSGVKKLVEALEDLDSPYEIYYLTTYLCAAHRKEKIQEIREKLDQKEPIIVVSTSLIECGVDLSFEMVVRNLAGFPSIVQSCGRGNRHGERELGFGYIVDWDEKTGGIENFAFQYNASKELLRRFKKKPEKYDSDLLSERSLNKYYKNYFSESYIRNYMAYPVKIEGQDYHLYKLLDGEDMTLQENQERENDFLCSCPFQTVNDHYQVIDSKTVALLVPYKEGKELQGKLLSLYQKEWEEKRKILNSIQSYTVNVFADGGYSGVLKKLNQAGGLMEVEGLENIYLVKDGFYSDQYGVLEEGTQSFLLMD